MTQVDFYDKTQIDAMNVGKETDTASASGSLWARLKDALNKIAGKADDDAVVKLTGAQTKNGVLTLSDSPIVPDTPATEHSAINQIWAENAAHADDTVNNLLHKEGPETITEVKTVKMLHPDENSNIYTLLGGYNGISVEDDRLTDRTSNPSVNISRALTRLVELNGNLGYSTITTNINANGDRYMRMQIHTGTKFIEISIRHDGATGADYGYCPQRITSSTSLSGTTYDNDIVTIKTLKELGLIS